jgi:hypothetical protein
MQPPAVTVTIDTAHTVRTFDPRTFVGAGVDGRPEGDAARVFQPPNVAAMRSAGLHQLTYRLRTELGGEAWHWNPRGRWSDAAHARGYWTSSATPDAPITESYGYRLPRRGNTFDQAENDGWSRITDGDTATFWKSDPYLDERWTGEPQARHPQRVVLDFGTPRPVSAVRLQWGRPWARHYVVERWVGDDSLTPDDQPAGEWRPFPRGEVYNATGGDVVLRLADQPLRVRWLRVTMLASAHVAVVRGSHDPRDAAGYALRELGAGTVDSAGTFVDVVRHAPAHAQTPVWVTSTDPWHRAIDRDPETEQPGIDRVVASGLTNGLPMLVPVGVLYDTPENGAALLRYLRTRRVPVRGVELGEEPDGQYVSPDDYGALYLQAAEALRRVDPYVALGGPSFQSVELDVRGWPDVPEPRPWLARFRDFLDARGAARTFGFFSFEWYPFDAVCDPTEPQLRDAPAVLRDAFTRLAPGIRGAPVLVSEFGYSAFAAQAQVELAGALLDADVVGTLLGLGADAAYLYGYEPAELQRSPGCERWGNNAMFLAGEDGRIRDTTAVYHAARLLTHVWTDSTGGAHVLVPARADLRDSSGAAVVTAYALRRPDGAWSVLLVHKDSLRTARVSLRLAADTLAALGTVPTGTAEVTQLSAEQYAWAPNGAEGRPARSRPPARRTQPASEPIELAGYSVTVVVLRRS